MNVYIHWINNIPSRIDIPVVSGVHLYDVYHILGMCLGTAHV